MSNDCTFVNNLIKKKNFDNVNDNSSELIYTKITDYQLNIKVEGKFLFFILLTKIFLINNDMQVLMI